MVVHQSTKSLERGLITKSSLLISMQYLKTFEINTNLPFIFGRDKSDSIDIDISGRVYEK